jgi:thiosulfate/3-mercaptopyruvate sulfurtransferase
MLHSAWLTVVLVIPAADGAKKDAYPRADLLMEPAELAKPEVLKKFRILDARPKEEYEAGHLPGAVWVDHAAWSKGFAADSDKRQWEGRLRALGIALDNKVVVYDDSLSKDAARIWWIARYAGAKDVRLLNGGWKGWVAAGNEVSTKAPIIVKVEGGPRVVSNPKQRLATKEDVLHELDRRNGAYIVDARSTGEYCGTTKTAKRNGSIPGANHLEWSDLLDKKTHRFKSAAELRKLFREARIELTVPCITYCQSGGRASVMAFALELMGARDVRNYYGSWAEWGNAEDTPVVQPNEKSKTEPPK